MYGSLRLLVLGSMRPNMLVMIRIGGGCVESRRQYHCCFVRYFKVPLNHMKSSVSIFEKSIPGLYVANDVTLVMMGCNE